MSEITLYDLPTKQSKCWSPNPWKTRLILNFKDLPYTTAFVEYPDIEATLSPHVPPNPPGGTPYTIPAIRIGNQYIMESRAIAARLEELHPTPSLHLDSPILEQVYGLVGKHMEPLRSIWMPLVSQNLLNPRAKEYFDRTREARVGMPLPQLLAEKGGKEAWVNAGPGTKALAELLEKEGGPFFMGHTVSYADFVVLGLLQFYKQLDEERVFKLVIGMEPSLGKLYDAGKQWLERDDQ